MACTSGHVKVVDFLLKNQADVRSRDAHGRTPLHNACLQGHYQVVDLLLKNGADTWGKDNQNSTPLTLACNNGFLQVVDFLIMNGAEIYSTSRCLLLWSTRDGRFVDKEEPS